MMKIPFFFFVFFLISLATPVKAAEVVWRGDDAIFLPEENISLDRPDSRWRVVEEIFPDYLKLVRYQKGQNVEIVLKKHVFYKLPRVKFRRGNRVTFDQLFWKALLKSYEENGFKFIQREFDEKHIAFALGTNAKRELLLLHFVFPKNRFSSQPVVVEMLVPREGYADLKQDFLKVTESLKL